MPLGILVAFYIHAVKEDWVGNYPNSGMLGHAK